MATIRDPAFWKRFSLAVHLDEEKSTLPDTVSGTSNGSRPSMKHTESWIDRVHKKRRRTKYIGFLIAFLILLVSTAIVFVILWLTKNGLFSNKPTTSTTTTNSG